MNKLENTLSLTNTELYATKFIKKNDMIAVVRRAIALNMPIGREQESTLLMNQQIDVENIRALQP